MTDDLTAAANLALERGVIGFVLLDERLLVCEVHGALAQWVEAGTALDEALPQLVGLEDNLRALQRRPYMSEALPNVGLHSGGHDTGKLNIQIFWHPARRRFVVVFTQEATQTELELERRREVQRRLHAEAREIEMAKVLRRTNAELERANQDLAEFAYVLSHDLKAPLRAMRRTAEIIEDVVGGHAPDAVHQHFARLHALGKRMNSMMTGLLEYSRIGRKDDVLATVDTRALVEDVVASLPVPDAMHMVIEGTWPEIQTFSEPLDRVLRNLVGNAVKHHDTQSGTVRIAGKVESGTLRMTIADDGPGIAPAYHEAIFEPFRVVDPDANPDSSGVGLALVRKTIELIGGTISVHSDPARKRGTEFVIDWPIGPSLGDGARVQD